MSVGGGLAVNVAVVVVEVGAVFCGEWMLCMRVCLSVRAATGRGDPCDSQRGESLWIKSHMHPLCGRTMAERLIRDVLLLREPK